RASPLFPYTTLFLSLGKWAKENGNASVGTRRLMILRRGFARRLLKIVAKRSCITLGGRAKMDSRREFSRLGAWTVTTRTRIFAHREREKAINYGWGLIDLVPIMQTRKSFC